ncbi:MAG: hypothetical protein EBR82_55610 [Caulobacteraceae bacterium]|nr:hypothetical protein [Caulobacteraceae bacterium]
MSALELPDSLAWRADVLHERERIIRLLEQRREDLCDPAFCNWDVVRREAARSQLRRAIEAILEGE